MAAISAVLFDLDGVLISTERGVISLWQSVLSTHGIVATVDELHRHAIGCAPEHTIEHFLSGTDEATRAAALAAVRSAERSLDFDIVPGAPQLLAALSKAGIPTGCVTGASEPRLARALRALGAATSVTTSVVWGDVPHGKPAPDCYLLGAARLHLPPAACLVIEDSTAGVTAAVAAGCPCLGLMGNGNGDAEALAGAGSTVVIESLLSLTLSTSYDGGHVLSTDEEDFYFPRPRPMTADDETGA